MALNETFVLVSHVRGLSKCGLKNISDAQVETIKQNLKPDEFKAEDMVKVHSGNQGAGPKNVFFNMVGPNGEAYKQADFDAGKPWKIAQFLYGISYLSGGFMHKTRRFLIAPEIPHPTIFEGGAQIYQSKHVGKPYYHVSWGIVGRDSVQVGRNVYYTTAESEVVRINIAGNVQNNLERVVCKMDNLVHFAINKPHLVCLSHDGKVRTSSMFSKSGGSIFDIRAQAKKQHVEYSQPESTQRVFTAIAAFKQFIAVGDYVCVDAGRNEFENTIWLMNRTGGNINVQTSKINNNIKRDNTVHSLFFTKVNNVLFLLVGNYFEQVQLYAVVNGKHHGDLKPVGVFTIRENNMMYYLCPDNRRPGHFITGLSQKSLQFAIQF